ncbi:MIP/aquaporin family protein [Nonomuraea salmonea]|uniref:MIP/aquaporin family protein n=1 Tax=Nonomuraea salmonea TaxID=46181 RepID=UPI002FECA423
MAHLLTQRKLTGELIAEFLGTMVLILFGCGVVAQVIAAELGDHDSIAWAWGIGVTLGVYVAGRTTGAHINPAVTLGFALFRGFPWPKVLPYALAQTLGAFVGALIVRWNYTEVLAMADPGHTIKTQIVFSTLPGNGTLPVSMWGGLRDQIIGTAILLFVLFALSDVLNMAPGANLGPFIIGLLIVGIGMSFGTDAGYAINPARDFGPPDWPAGSPATTGPGEISTATRTGGSPSSARWSAQRSEPLSTSCASPASCRRARTATP